MTTRTGDAFNEWDMQDLSTGHKLRNAKTLCYKMEQEISDLQEERDKINAFREKLIGKMELLKNENHILSQRINAECEERHALDVALAEETKERAQAQIERADYKMDKHRLDALEAAGGFHIELEKGNVVYVVTFYSNTKTSDPLEARGSTLRSAIEEFFNATI